MKKFSFGGQFPRAPCRYVPAIEACKLKLCQLILLSFLLLIDQPIHKIQLSDWLNLEEEIHRLLHDVASVLTKQRQ